MLATAPVTVFVVEPDEVEPEFVPVDDFEPVEPALPLVPVLDVVADEPATMDVGAVVARGPEEEVL